MAKKKSKSTLAKALGRAGREAIDAHKEDEVTYGTAGDLPAGIEGGIAQLCQIKFGKFERGDLKGEPFFLAAGIVKTPEEVNGTPVQGCRTQIGPEPLCDTPDRRREDLDAHVGWVLNELRKLGVDTSNVDLESLEEVCEDLVEEAPHFRFRTWVGQPTEEFKNPRVQHEWRGATEYQEEDSEDVEEDDGGGDDEEEEEEQELDPVLAKLAKKADADDEKAQTKLTERAEANGLDPEDYDTWLAVAQALAEADEEGEEEEEEEEGEDEEEEEEETAPPEKGDVFQYKPKGKRKSVECEVTAVFPKKETVNLKNLDDGTVYKNVPWDQLLE